MLLFKQWGNLTKAYGSDFANKKLAKANYSALNDYNRCFVNDREASE